MFSFFLPGHDYQERKRERHQCNPRIIRLLHARGVAEMFLKGKSEPHQPDLNVITYFASTVADRKLCRFYGMIMQHSQSKLA
jgi:hypothetical protein